MLREAAPLDIAVVGTGISGMGAAWLLAQNHNVTVYEQATRTGGHSNTVIADVADGSVAVDTGFIVYNQRNYPNLVALFEHLGVATTKSNMSFAASLAGGALEYNGTDINGLFGQRRNLVRPQFWRMLRDIRRFHREAPKLLQTNEPTLVPLGQYLREHRYSDTFINDHLLPMGAAIWSTSLQRMLDYPAIAFIRFFANHGLLQATGQPEWRTVKGGSREYVRRLTAGYADKIMTGRTVQSIRRRGEKVYVQDSTGCGRFFDHVVLATHADQALKLLSDCWYRERRLLAHFKYSTNRAILHTDSRFMPKRKRVWSSWNYLQDSVGDNSLCVTYWMNNLQELRTTQDLFVTLNPCAEPAGVLQEFTYHHPIFDAAAIAAQRELWSIQGTRNTWFCGSYFGYGFHEDGLQAGLVVAEALGGVARPWNAPAELGRIHIGKTKRGAGKANAKAAA